jgi:hypothetical protein
MDIPAFSDRMSAIRRVTAATIAVTLMSSSTFAATSLINSHASDIQVSVDIASLLNGSLGPFSEASGYEDATHQTYDNSETFLSAAASGEATTLGAAPTVTGLTLTSKTLTSSASGETNPIHVTASSEVEGLALTLKEAGIIPLISLGGANNDIKSTSSATAISSGDSVVGSSSIAGLTLDVLGVDIDLSAYANAAPNTKVVLSGLAAALTGLDITVNKQTVVTTSDSLSILTDALDIDFTHLSLGGIVPINTVASGDIIIAESFAEVPEPAVWAELLLGFACLGGLIRGRQRLRLAV